MGVKTDFLNHAIPSRLLVESNRRGVTLAFSKVGRIGHDESLFLVDSSISETDYRQLDIAFENLFRRHNFELKR